MYDDLTNSQQLAKSLFINTWNILLFTPKYIT